MWKEIAGYEGLYEVSETGLVRSLDRVCGGKRKRRLRGVILKQTLTTTGYYKCELCKDGVAISKKVHRLVANAFIENPNNLPHVNHKDLNPLNNSVENLEWCTQLQNVRHARANGHCGGFRSLSDEQIKYIQKNYVPYSRDRNQRFFAAMFGVDCSTISVALRRNYL